jgi:nucleotide-binding universal stress UspA family protein
MPFTKILVALDFSAPSKKALSYGLAWAEQYKAKLILAHIVPDSSALLYAFPTELSDIEKDQSAKAKQEIDKLVPAKTAAKLNVKTIVRIGGIEEELLRIVADEGLDLMVLGTHGRRYLGRWFIGSVTEHMLRKVPVPLLTVSHIEPETLITSLPLEQIVYATDLSEPADGGLNVAIELARKTAARLTVIHVIDDEDRLSWGPALLAYLDRDKLIQEAQTKLHELIARHNTGLHIEAVVVEGKPYRKIIDLSEQQKADLIVLNLQNKSALDRALLGSTAERVVRLAHTPVLSLPRTQPRP